MRAGVYESEREGERTTPREEEWSDRPLAFAHHWLIYDGRTTSQWWGEQRGLGTKNTRMKVFIGVQRG